MRAATIRDGRLIVTDHPDPEPAAGEALVRVASAGLNTADLMQMRGEDPRPLVRQRTSPGSSSPARSPRWGSAALASTSATA